MKNNILDEKYRIALNDYFNGWIQGDKKLILDAIHEDIYIEECYGPCYKGKDQVIVWLDNWFCKGKVNSWEIIKEWIDKNNNTYFCKWEFSCSYDNKDEKFLGISVITFKDYKIHNIEEFQSTFTHKYPY